MKKFGIKEVVGPGMGTAYSYFFDRSAVCTEICRIHPIQAALPFLNSGMLTRA